MLELLRDRGTDLALTFDGTNLMHYACMNAQQHVVRWLVKAGHAQMALARSHENKLPILYACESGDDSTLSFLRYLPDHMVQRETRAAEIAQGEVEDAEQYIRISQQSQPHEQMTVERAVWEELLAEKRGDLEVAQRRADETRAELAAAKAQAAWLAAAAEGWVEAAMASPCKRVSDDASRFQAANSAEEALTSTLPHLLAERAPLAAFVELEPHLKRSRIGDAAAGYRSPPRDSNPWLQVMQTVSEHGRADVMRWAYAANGGLGIMSCIYDHDQAVDPLDSPTTRGETYEELGRKLADKCEEPARRSFIQLYDDLRAAKAAQSAWFDAVNSLKQVFGFTKESYYRKQAADFPEPAIADVLGAISLIDSAYAAFPDGMRRDFVLAGEEVFDPPTGLPRGCGEILYLLRRKRCRDFVATRGYLSIVRWFIEERPGLPGSNVDSVLRSVHLVVKHLPYESGAGTLHTLAYLVQWLIAHGGAQLLVDARFSQFSDSTYEDMPGVSEPNQSLLDVAVHNAVVCVPCYGSDVSDDLTLTTGLARCWECIDLLQAHVPDCQLTDLCVSSMNTYGSGRSSEWWSERQGNVLRFLQFAESKGFDLSGPVGRGSETSIAQALTNGGWIGTVRWLAEERGVDVQHLVCGKDARMLGERQKQVKDELMRLQRTQRQRHAARAKGARAGRSAGLR